MIANGIDWIESVQNTDGGWVKQDDSFIDPSQAGKGSSTPSQTAWALLALLKHFGSMRESVTRGPRWLVENQRASFRSPVLGGCPGTEKQEIREIFIENGNWGARDVTGVVHPNQVCTGYALYRHYLSMIALWRYLTTWENRKSEKEMHKKDVGGK